MGLSRASATKPMVGVACKGLTEGRIADTSPETNVSLNTEPKFAATSPGDMLTSRGARRLVGVSSSAAG